MTKRRHSLTPIAMALLLVGPLAGGCVEFIRYDEDVDLLASDACQDATRQPSDELELAGLSALLADHVQLDAEGNARMDYAGLLDSDSDQLALDDYLQRAACVQPQAGDLAFWLNTYNALVIRGVLDELVDDGDFRVDRDGFVFFSGPRHSVAGVSLSLDDLEHGVLRADAGRVTLNDTLMELHTGVWQGEEVDARLHMAINCAASSCPNLNMAAYTASDLDVALADATTRFLDNPDKGAGPMGISSLFKDDWFGSDFETHAGSVAAFIENHRSDGLTDVDLDTQLEYDWSLNRLP